MKTPIQYLRELRETGESLAQFNQRACIAFAEVLRLNDRQKLLCRELDIPHEDSIPAAYFDCIYRLLTFGPLRDRLTLMTGSVDEIEVLVSRTQTAKGFTSNDGHWMEL